MSRRTGIYIAIMVLTLGWYALPSAAFQSESGWVDLFNGKHLWGWTAMHDAELKINREENSLSFLNGAGWVCSDQLYDDFILMFQSRVQSGSTNALLFFRAGPEGESIPDEGYRISLGGQNMGSLDCEEETLIGDKNSRGKPDEWTQWILTVEGKKATLMMDGQRLWTAEKLRSGRGLLGFHPLSGGLEIRNIRIREIGYTDLIAGWPEKSELTIRSGDSDAWKYENDGELRCTKDGGWLGTRASDYGNFDLKIEYLVPVNGNSGVFIRYPGEGTSAYTGMEVQVIDDDATKWELEEWQKCGAIYHEIPPSVRATRKAGTWQTMEIICDGSFVRIYINGVQITNVDLDQCTESHSDAASLKDRPRVGYIGFQNYGGSGVAYRNVRVKRL
ncbi:MAG: DUF1080 domain-containing protein [bacterium]